MTDCDFLYDILKDHQWHSTSEILRYSIEERGHGLTVHSRVAQLRGERNLNIVHRQVKGHRADAHQYRLVMALSEPDRTAVWGDSSGSLSGVESKPAIRPTGMSSRAKDAEVPASRPQDGAAPFSGAHPAPTAAQLSRLMSPPPEAAGPASPSSPEGCPQNDTGNESAQQLSFEVAA